MQSYRLGIDVGTASAGIAAVSLNAKGQPEQLIWHHVRIFKEPLEDNKGTLVSKKAGRRLARMQRRIIDRRASRLKHIAHLFGLLGLKPEQIDAQSYQPLPEIRAKAAESEVSLADLARIFLRLSKRRGYKGEFRPNKTGEVANGVHQLIVEMRQLAQQNAINLQDETDTGVTLGQYLFHRLNQGLPVKLKIREEEAQKNTSKKTKTEEQSPNLYALRTMVEHEFHTIWQTQAKYHPILNDSHDNQAIKDYFYHAIFWQRPLKSPVELVAKCSLEPTLLRAPRAQMAFQRFRIEKTIADLRWGVGKKATPLNLQQKQIIRDLLNSQAKLKFTQIYQAFTQANCAPTDNVNLNLEHINREELQGNTTLAALRELDKYSQKHHPEIANQLEARFLALDDKTQISVINFLAELGSPEQLDNPDWHTSFISGKSNTIRQFKPAVIDFINQLKQHDKFDRLSAMDFDSGRASYSIKALNTLSDWLQAPNWHADWNPEQLRIDEEAAIQMCYPDIAQKTIKQLQRLPTPPKTGNAVVDGSLRQIQWIVNKMIKELGQPPSEIVVEMAREMSLGISRRNERSKDNNKNQKARNDAEKAIRLHGQTPTPNKIRRYLLWAEQNQQFCPYCSRSIGLEQALSGAATEYEHIIPKSLTQVGLKRSEIVLAHSACNQEKGDRTPWQAWGDTDRWQSIEAAAQRFEKNHHYRKAKLLRLKDFEHEVLTDQSISEFADRQFHQTSWIAKAAGQWLQNLCPNRVSVSRGEMTALLRRHWKLETVIPEVRLENQLPILDDEGKTISPDEFLILKKHLEGHPILPVDRHQHPNFEFNRRPDKRIDHRHHLIDAITIALTSRGLFQKMATDYKKQAESLKIIDDETTEQRERRLKNHTRQRIQIPEPPLKTIRESALQAVRACQISIKPDRYPDGEFLKATAYGIAQAADEQRPRLTLRKSLDSLLGKTDAATRKNIDSIVSDDVRQIVSELFEQRIADGMEPKLALSLPITHPQYRTPIRKVRCFTDNYADVAEKISFKSRQGEHYKYLLNGGYAYLEIDKTGCKPPKLITIKDAIPIKNCKTSPEIVRICKGDVVNDIKNQQFYRVAYFTIEGNIFLIPIHDPRSFDKITESGSGKKRVAFSQAEKRLVLVRQ
jgi:CRISPR-associated endonuclease Csn1